MRAVGQQLAASYHFTDEILPVLTAIQHAGPVRLVDLLFVQKDAEGTVTVQELSELGEEDLFPYAAIIEDLACLFTAEDVAALAEQLPATITGAAFGHLVDGKDMARQ